LSGKDFQVEGTLKYVNNSADGPKTVARRSFSLTVHDCLWKLHGINILPPPRGGDASLYVEVANDGESIYTTIVFDPHLMSEKVPNTRTFVSNAVTVVNGNVPFVDQSFTAALWLAYASECHFRTLSNNRAMCFLSMNPAMFHPDITLPFIRTYNAAASSDFPDEIVFLNEGRHVRLKPGGGVVETPLEAPFDKGFVENRYKVLEFTDGPGWRLPKKYQISYFWAQPAAADNSDTRLIATIDVEAISFDLHPQPLASTQSVKQLSAVYDNRVATSNGLAPSYLTTNRIYETNAPELSRIVADLDRRSRKAVAGQQSTAGIVYAYFVLCTVALGISLWLLRRRLKRP